MTDGAQTTRPGGLPTAKADARRWIREHWADLIGLADMGGVGDLECDLLNAVWSDECARISKLLAPWKHP